MAKLLKKHSLSRCFEDEERRLEFFLETPRSTWRNTWGIRKEYSQIQKKNVRRRWGSNGSRRKRIKKYAR